MKRSLRFATIALASALALGALAGCSSEEKEASVVPLKDAQIGDLVVLGAYEQDNDTSNGKEPIEWRVLDSKDGKVLLISSYALDTKPVNNNPSMTDWDTSDLKLWVTTVFPKEADLQNAEEFTILSAKEAEGYFDNYKDRKCDATPFAVSQGAAETDGCSWWLRPNGNSSGLIPYVEATGYINDLGCKSNVSFNAIRPAMWIAQ